MSDPIGYNGSFVDPEAAVGFLAQRTLPIEVPTPADLIKAAEAALEPRVSAEVSYVVGEIKRRNYRGGEVCVAARDKDAAVHSAVVERFRAKGWRVSVDSDQREGSTFYRLAPA